MGCPAGIGPEIILRYFSARAGQSQIQPVVIGDIGILDKCSGELGLDIRCVSWEAGKPLPAHALPVLSCSSLDPDSLRWGHPDRDTAQAMVDYIRKAVALIEQGVLDGMVTCPISKEAMQAAGHIYPGHTEMLAELTGTKDYAMMLAGDRLRVTLVTIHRPLRQVPDSLSKESIAGLIRITHRALVRDFALPEPRIAVAGLNPHAGESGLFGDEEISLIRPAVLEVRGDGISADGPFPPDTVFFKAAAGDYDAVVCMYHDQGLIPFKLLHFSDGVNVTLGLPLVRTSVDHGTAYDIAGKGVADPGSLAAAVELAGIINSNRREFDNSTEIENVL
jgi:4-hydroxythreonine-4-phosphate dehydrogenase